jgi:hypothetical protein
MRSGSQLAAYLLMGGTINSFTDSELSRASPEDNHVEPDSVQPNRKGGCRVSWQAAPSAFEDHGQDGTSAIFRYWAAMAETVGHYGSTSGEPPYSSGARTAYLKGRPGHASHVRSS